MSTETAAAPRPARRPRVATVADVRMVGPHLARIVLEGDELAGLDPGPETDAYVKLQLPPEGADYAPPFAVEEIRATRERDAWARVRTYTVREWDPTGPRLTLEIVVHEGEDGPGGRWARTASPGDPVQVVGPGGGWGPEPGAAWHLFVGDLCVVPAIANALEALPASGRAIVVTALEDGRDEVVLPSDADVATHWVVSDPGAAADAVVEALRRVELPTGEGSAFVHGEAALVRAVRTHLVADRGLDRARVHASGYWRRAAPDERWREEKRDWLAASDADLDAATT